MTIFDMVVYSSELKMKKILKKTVFFGRATLVVVTVLALIVTGASSAQRLFSVYQGPSEEDSGISTQAQLMPGPPSPDEAAGEMTPDGKPNSEQSAFLTAPLLSTFANPDDQCCGIVCGEAALAAPDRNREQGFGVATSTSRISSRLGRQFTLVGAHPSGTS